MKAKVTNQIRSKVLKAAWKTYRKRSNWSFSACLRSAWKWAKENLIDITNNYKIWSPREGFFRLYFGQDYIQINVKHRNPKGYYESHRYCKGERFATGYYKLVGISEDILNDLVGRIMIITGTSELIESKF